jgi:hypothetical protein
MPETVGVGVDDFVLEDRLARLDASVERILQDRKVREEGTTIKAALKDAGTWGASSQNSAGSSLLTAISKKCSPFSPTRFAGLSRSME